MGSALETVEEVFRRESGRITATLIRLSGSFDLAEEAMQDAYVRAINEWNRSGVPRNPAAWLMTTAQRRNRAAGAPSAVDFRVRLPRLSGKSVGRPIMIRMTGLALAFSVLASSCASVPVAPHKELEGVRLTFDHLGGEVDPLDQRMAEKGQLQAAHRPGVDYWVRLTNNSSYVITFRTFSTYIAKPLKWFDLENGSKVIALEDGAEITLPFGMESRRGTEIPSSSGIDMFWMSFLPPGRSAVFNVPRSALRYERKVYVEFQKAAEPSGTSYRTYFAAPRSPN